MRSYLSPIRVIFKIFKRLIISSVGEGMRERMLRYMTRRGINLQST